MLLFPGGPGGGSGSGARDDAEDAGAEDADVSELVQVRDGDVQGLAAAHREAGDGAVFAIGEHAIVLLDVGHDVRLEVLDELIRWRLRSRSRRSARTPAEGTRVAGGHDDNHRLRLPGGDQVVQNEAGAADRAPGIVAV